MKGEGRYVVGKLADLPPGTMKLVPVGKFGVGVYNVGGKFYALTNYCPHRGGPLCTGRMVGWAEPGEHPWEITWSREGEILRCPWHQWEFDIVTGRAIVYQGTKRPYSIRMYPVEVDHGEVVLQEV
jgi:nitrite reductase/ring-hydroxylating ferredoxin subunit